MSGEPGQDAPLPYGGVVSGYFREGSAWPGLLVPPAHLRSLQQQHGPDAAAADAAEHGPGAAGDAEGPEGTPGSPKAVDVPQWVSSRGG